MSPALGDRAPTAEAAMSAAEFVEAMRQLRKWSGRTYWQLSAIAVEFGESLSAGALAAALGGWILPAEDLVAVFVRVCGCSEAEQESWLAAHRRLARVGQVIRPAAVSAAGPISSPPMPTAGMPTVTPELRRSSENPRVYAAGGTADNDRPSDDAPRRQLDWLDESPDDRKWWREDDRGDDDRGDDDRGDYDGRGEYDGRSASPSQRTDERPQVPSPADDRRWSDDSREAPWDDARGRDEAGRYNEAGHYNEADYDRADDRADYDRAERDDDPPTRPGYYDSRWDDPRWDAPTEPREGPSEREPALDPAEARERRRSMVLLIALVGGGLTTLLIGGLLLFGSGSSGPGAQPNQPAPPAASSGSADPSNPADPGAPTASSSPGASPSKKPSASTKPTPGPTTGRTSTPTSTWSPDPLPTPNPTSTQPSDPAPWPTLPWPRPTKTN